MVRFIDFPKSSYRGVIYFSIVVHDMIYYCLTEIRIINPNCKVEFIQPSNWLYSVPNLLVIQHLVTLYLGGFDVRVVSEIE